MFRKSSTHIIRFTIAGVAAAALVLGGGVVAAEARTDVGPTIANAAFTVPAAANPQNHIAVNVYLNFNWRFDGASGEVFQHLATPSLKCQDGQIFSLVLDKARYVDMARYTVELPYSQVGDTCFVEAQMNSGPNLFRFAAPKIFNDSSHTVVGVDGYEVVSSRTGGL